MRPPRVQSLRLEGSGTFALRVWHPFGGWAEAVPGQACLAGRALSEGTLRRDWLRLAIDLEDQGMSLSTFGSLELFGLSLNGLAEDWRIGIEWAAEVLMEPSFDPERVEWLRLQTVAELDSLTDQPDVVTGWQFLKQLYGEHPAGRPTQGTRESLEELTAEHCRSFHQLAMATLPIISLVGDLDPEEVAVEIAKKFGASNSPMELPDMVLPPRLAPSRSEVETSASDQVHLYMGHPTVARNHEDLAALEVLAIVMGAGSGLHGRIPQAIREEQGLAYSAQANPVSGASAMPGRLTIYLGTAPENLERAEQSVRTEVSRIVNEGVTADEMESARSYLLGREPFRQETARQWGDLLAQSSYFGMPWNDAAWRRQRLAAVTLEEIGAAARSHLHPDQMSVTAGVPSAS